MTLLRATRYAGLALLLWIAPALAQTNLGQIPPGTVVGNPTSANAFPSAVPLASLGLGFSVMAYGADPSGSADSTSAFQQAIAAASAAAPATVTIPCGNYRLTPGVLTINTNNVSIMGQSQNCVNLNRYADTGALISFGKATAYLFSTTVSGFTINDIAAQTNVTGYSTCANSPYQLVFDGMNGLQLSNVRVNFGCGAFAFRAVIFSECIGGDGSGCDGAK